MTKRTWEITGFGRDEAALLLRSGLSPLVAVTLAARGITQPEEAAAFVRCGADSLHDPFLLQDMDRAVQRIRRAVSDREHVAIYGDYDVDGMTATAVLSEYLRAAGLHCETYIPDRLDEGYGVKAAALDRLREQGVTLVITVDCGVTAVDEALRAKELGLDLIITDHHKCGPQLPDAIAVVNPQRKDGSVYPETVLAGVGVAFKVVCAAAGPEHTEELLEKYGDLVALGTLADVMNVLGENRYLISRGLSLLRSGKRPGLRQLCLASGRDPQALTATGISYQLAPRLNAAGRLGQAETSLRLLLTENEAEAEALASALNSMNRERQRLEAEMEKEALCMLDRSPAEGPVVLAGSSWHQGVAGIVASRITDRFGVPTVMICLSDGVGKGSCRSVGSFSIFSALDTCRDLLTTFGGHEMAAGLTLPEENVPLLRARLTELWLRSDTRSAAAVISIDAELPKAKILTVENVRALELLEPCGNGNPTPTFCIRNADVRGVTAVGGGKHTKLQLLKQGETLDCICFGRSPEDLAVMPGDRADVAFQPQINSFRGRNSVQLNLTDLQTC